MKGIKKITKSMTWENIKDKEKKVADILASYLNSTFGTSYTSVTNNDERTKDSDIDVYLKDSVNESVLNLQITTHDGPILEIFGKRNRGLIVRDSNRVGRIKDSIKNKNKYADKSNLVLVVFSEYSNLIDANFLVKEFKGNQDIIEYKNVYWVKVSNGNKDDKNQVICIK